MIKKISRINNLGRFESFAGASEFKKNTIIFGFNGAGKSTLSDIFHSLSKDNNDDSLARRRTLNREGEVGEKDIDIEIESDNGTSFSYKGDKWDIKPDNLFVFNEKYVNDHVFVSKQVVGDAVPIGLGKEGARLMKQRESLEQTQKSLMEDINQDITLLISGDIKIADFSKQKITPKTNLKRFQNISKFELYPIGGEAKIKEMQRLNAQYSKELELVEECCKMYGTINNIEPFVLGDTFKTIRRIPRITSKDIATFIEKNLTSADIKWAVRGYLKQKNRNICPMCGQAIADIKAISFFNKLGKYVSQNKNEAINTFSNRIANIASKLELIRIDEKIAVFRDITEKLLKSNLLLKKDMTRLKYGLSWTSADTLVIDGVIRKIRDKAENPYEDVALTEKENEKLKVFNSVINNIIVLGQILRSIQEKVENKSNKSFQQEEMGMRYKLSYEGGGVYRKLAEDMKVKAATYLKNVELIADTSQKINDCYNRNRLNEVNNFLHDLNTHILIEVTNGEYSVRLKDFIPQRVDKSKETIFSEGENRAIAFAYFLAEITNAENGMEKRTIVVDDPISSMDLSRKSIISHKVAELMNHDGWQVILMTHDISFVERVRSYLETNIECGMLELRSGKNDFIQLAIDSYLTDDKTVYSSFIAKAGVCSDEVDKVIAMMSLRPFAYVNKVSEEEYEKIEKKTTYFAHTLYSKNGRIAYKEKDYENKALKRLVKLVSKATNCKLDADALVGSYSFPGFDFARISGLYRAIPLDSMDNMRKKVMLLRPLIEACFYQFSLKGKFDPEHIGSMYKSTIRANKGDTIRHKICEDLLELYDASKKYHHGADDGSLLGISWINPNEVEFFDEKILDIIDRINLNGMVRELSA